MSRPRVSAGHVIWAWESHIADWHREGLTVNAIRVRLREHHHLAVGAQAIRAVLASYDEFVPASSERSGEAT